MDTRVKFLHSRIHYLQTQCTGYEQEKMDKCKFNTKTAKTIFQYFFTALNEHDDNWYLE